MISPGIRQHPAEQLSDRLSVAVVHYFDRLGLPIPPIPEALQNSRAWQTPSVVGSCLPPDDLYDLGSYLRHAADPGQDRYLLIGHTGHGTHSYALHYYLVLDTLAVFLQIGCGGAYRDTNTDKRRLGERFDRLRRLFDVASHSRSPAPVQRLIVFDSDYAGQGLTGITRLDAPSPWKSAVFPDTTTTDALSAALEWLRG